MEKYWGRNITDACLMHQLSPFITPINQRPEVCPFLLKWVAINTQIQKKPPLRQYLKCALQNRNCGMKILYLVLGTVVIVSFFQKSKTIIFKSGLSLPPLQILHQETRRDVPCKPLPPRNASGYSHKTIPRTTIQAPASQTNHHHPPSI